MELRWECSEVLLLEVMTNSATLPDAVSPFVRVADDVTGAKACALKSLGRPSRLRMSQKTCHLPLETCTCGIMGIDANRLHILYNDGNS